MALVLLAATGAAARPRAAVEPFVVAHGSETLAYFGPEVARALTAALEGAGVETGAAAEVAVTGRVEELEGERVRLVAQLRGRTLTAEGPLEALDAVATQLGNRIATLLVEDPAAQRAAERRAREAARVVAAVPPARGDKARADKDKNKDTDKDARPAKSGAAAPEPVHGPAVEPGHTPPVELVRNDARPEPHGTPAEAPRVEAHGDGKLEPRPDTKLDPRSDGKLEPRPEGRPEAKPEARPDGRPEPRGDLPRLVDPPRAEPSRPAPAAPARPETPAWSPPRVDGAPATPPPYWTYVRGRVVAHAVAEPAAQRGSAGIAATQALFQFLGRRLRLSVVPTGVGITAPSLASDEAYRAGARAVVMARLEAVDFLPGPSVRCRLEVVVVRDGRPVMRRVVESMPSDPTRRGPGSEPVYQAVTLALESLVPELVGALADVR